MSTGSKTIAELPEVQILDDKDQFLFFQNSTKKTKRITKGNMANSGGGLRGRFIDAATGNDVGFSSATAVANAATALSTAQGAQTSANGKAKVYYQSAEPTGGSYNEGDLWYDTDDNYKLYVRTGGAWVASFGPMLKLDGNNNVSGLQKVGGIDKAFVLVADYFQIWNGTSAEVAFEVVSDPSNAGNQVVRIKNAQIQTVDAGKLTAGFIGAQVISINGSNGGGATGTGGTGGYIESSSFVPTWTSGLTVRQYVTTGAYGNTLGKHIASDVVQVKVLQADGVYKLYQSLLDQGVGTTVLVTTLTSANNAPATVYEIVSLGSTTTQQWNSIGVTGTPVVGGLFTKIGGTGVGTGTVRLAPTAATIAPPAAGVAGGNANWSYIASPPTFSIPINSTENATIQNFGFRIASNGFSEFSGGLFRGAVIAQEGFFGTTKDAARIDANGLTIGSNGRIKSSGLTYTNGGWGEGSGFFLGNTGSVYEFFIGDSSKYVRWDGSNLSVSGNIVGGSTVGTAGTTGGLVINSSIGIKTANSAQTLTITGGVSNGISSGAQIDFGGNGLTNGNRGVLIFQGGSAGPVYGDDAATALNNGRIEFRTNTFDGASGITRGRFNTAGEFIVYRNASSPASGSLYTDGSGCAEFQANVGIGRPFLSVNAPGLNTGTVTGNLHVQTEIALYGSVNDKKVILTKNGTGTNEGVIYIKNNGGTTKVTLSAATGDVSADTFTSSSSKRFKTNIKKLNSGLEIIDKLRPVSFKRKGTKQEDIGLIAEEVDKILPVIVKHNSENEAEGLDYSKLTVILINAVKELSAEVKELKKKLKDADAN